MHSTHLNLIRKIEVFFVLLDLDYFNTFCLCYHMQKKNAEIVSTFTMNMHFSYGEINLVLFTPFHQYLASELKYQTTLWTAVSV